MPHGEIGFARHTRLLAFLGLGGVLVFVAAVLLLHATASPRQPWHMSEFANTRFGALWALGVLGFAAGGLALTLALRPALGGGFWRRIGLGMFWTASVGAFMLGIFPVDKDADRPTIQGVIHEEVGPPTFVLSGAAMVVLVPAFRAYRQWRPFAIASLSLGVLVTASALAYVAFTHQAVAEAGVAQRIMVGLICTWFVMVGIGLLRFKHDAVEVQQPTPSRTPKANLVPAMSVLLVPPPAPRTRSPSTNTRRRTAGKRPASTTLPRLRARKLVTVPAPRRRTAARRVAA